MMTINKLVKDALEKDERYRDDDINLYFKILLDLGYSKATSIYDILSGQKAGNVPSQDTVKRIRRLIQEENPHLRGKTYNLRQRLGGEQRKAYRERQNPTNK